jgi:hypothetical protein
MAVSTAVPCILLIRMSPRFKSWQAHQPSPQVTALSAASRERSLAAWAALGPHPHPRRQAHRPLRARPPGRQPPRPPRSVVAHPARGRQPRGRCGLLPCPPRSPPATGAPHAGLTCPGGQPQARPPPAPDPARVRHRPPRRPWVTSAASPASGPARPSTEPLDDAAAHRDLDPFPWCGLPCRIGLSPDAAACWGPDGRVRTDGVDTSRLDTGRVDIVRPDRRTPGRRTRVTGHRTGWTPDGWTPDGRTPDGLDTGRTGHQTAGHRTGGSPDPDDGTGWVDTTWWTRTGDDAMAGVLALPATATTPDGWMPAGRSAGQPPCGRPTSQDSSAAGLPGRARPPPRPSAAGATPPPSWRLGALLSSEIWGRA